MKESLYNINKSNVFRETFDSFDSIKKNGGTQTNVDLSNGVAEFDNSPSKVSYNTGLEGTFSIRIKFTPDNFSAAMILLDSRSSAGNGTGYIYTYSTTGDINSSSGTIYTNGVLGVSITAGIENEIIITGISLVKGTGSDKILLGSRYSNDEGLIGTMEIVEIYDRALTATEVSLLHDNELYKEPNDSRESGVTLIEDDLSTIGDWTGSAAGLSIVDNKLRVTQTNFGGDARNSHVLPSSAGTVVRITAKVDIVNKDHATIMRVYLNDSDIYVYPGSIVEGKTITIDTEVTLTEPVSLIKLYFNPNAGVYDWYDLKITEVFQDELTPIIEMDFVKNKSGYNEVITNNYWENGDAIVSKYSDWSLDTDGLYMCDGSILTETRLELITAPTGKTYRTIVIVSDYASGSAVMKYGIGAMGTSFEAMTSNGRYVFEGINLADGKRLGINVRRGGFVGKVDITIKEVNNENQTLTDVTFGQQGLLANSSTTKLDTGSTADLTGDRTFECIINPAGFGELDAGRIIDNGELYLTIVDQTTYVKLLAFSSGGTPMKSATNSILINDKTKYCIVTVTSAGITNFYIGDADNVTALNGTANQDSGTPTTGTTNIIIANKSNGTRTFDGAIKVVNVYEGLMTEKQITQRYNYWKSVRKYL